MNTEENLKIIELRNYLIKPDTRDRFIKYFESHFIDSQKELGGYPLGQFTVKNDDDKFFWIRGFKDMKARVAFLCAFYEQGLAWKKFGPEANEMMLDSDDVYLLRPLNDRKDSQDLSQTVSSRAFEKLKAFVAIDFYYSEKNHLDNLINFFQADYVPFLNSLKINDTTLWVSEMAENDFPHLPVIQDSNLLVAISSFENESEYQTKLKQINLANAELKKQMQKLINDRKSLMLYSTRKSFIGNSSLEKNLNLEAGFTR